ncbi:hypothetical protein G7A66_13820 [Altererythrobacter sp. SALINAS58]|uniref:hypothetical protein n=1 Tax=Alteripontixanthobacter muriae TaxID=2705546 RepID=UPI0015764B68|nr:hypothetical protein [Alteripontixanthobacter muriae]NTZ44139.1 hypothetical protein [Alteripontixanthobacter muriae]
MKRILWTMPVAAALALSACKDDPAPVTNNAQDAEGQVAGGTISDAMLPLATVRSGNSQSAPMARNGTSSRAVAGNGADEEGAAGDESDAQEEAVVAEPVEDTPATEEEAE